MGWVLLASRLPRSAVVCRKSRVFRFLSIRKVLVLPFAGGVSPSLGWFFFCFQRVIHRLVAPTTCSLTTCSLTTCMGVHYMRRIWVGGGSLYAENVAVGGFTICGENWPESLPPVDNFVARVAVGGPRSGCRRFRHPPRGRPRVAGPSEASLADAVGPRFASLEGS